MINLSLLSSRSCRQRRLKRSSFLIGQSVGEMKHWQNVVFVHLPGNDFCPAVLRASYSRKKVARSDHAPLANLA